MRRIELEIAGIRAVADLLDDQAPRTCQAIYELLPIHDRTIHVRWSGSAWRTEKNYPLQLGEIENKVTRLDVGDLIYYDDARYGLFKIAFAYGPCQWRDDAGELWVARFARVVENQDAFVQVCQRILFEGPQVVTISRKEG